MKKLLLCVLFAFYWSLFSQNYKITYLKSSNGTLIENQDPIFVFTNLQQTFLTSEAIVNQKSSFPYEQTLLIRTSNSLIQIANLNQKEIISMRDSLSLAKQTFELLPETKTIVGYRCKKAKAIVNSNTIEFWYTDDLKVKGSPTVLGQNLGLVLEMVRNGNFVITATKIEKVKAFPALTEVKKSIDALTYKDLLWKSRFTTIPIFKDQIINFSDASKSNDSILRFANGTIAVRKIKIPEIKVGSQIFVDVTEQSNGDAYDRTGSFFIIPTNKKQSFMDGLQNGAKTLPIYTNGNGKEYQGIVSTNDYNPVVELMRFFTPFGVKQYNTLQLKDKTWADNVLYRQDVSDLRSLLSNQEVWIGINIGNYDKGGHKVSANITIHDEEESTVVPTQILPLFCTNNIMEMAGQEYGTMFNSDKGLEVTFTLDKPVKNCKLRYITTGHGGWGNGDEFVPKKNSIFLDEKEAFSFIPWRQDCGSYRLSNPASGNFPNGLSSSDYSRSNWCPGTVTNPIFIDLGNLAAGTHSIQIKIPQGLPEGGSFSSWNVSGVLIGE
ncbi:PNGase F N-terminal domain-containing protein [Flavobacterium sp.]|uniref:PNGase F N-terminal domain-containing protein n=1 Tax=Flavobacterium sp. TaxID=239 RepID=UPI00248A80E2|nr:PNGase F N-terminal domain-containing protein [Flavobacterium sp.]MDI1316552.1 PNGase F N-terminal domain-containing protein [Flavobacterium sp.]